MIDLLEIAKLRPTVLGWMASWHGQQPVLLPFANYVSVSKGISASGDNIFLATVERTMTVVSWYQAVRVNTTNSSSAYWTLDLYRNASAAVKIAALDTSRLTAGTWAVLSVTIGAGLTAGDVIAYVQASKTGSPGTLDLGAPVVWVR